MKTVHTRITDELSDGELGTFHALLLDRRTTIAEAVEWLRDRGHGISKTAVGNYVQRFRRRPVFANLVSMGVSTEEEMRRHVCQASEQLQGEQLAHLAVFSAYLLTIGQKQGAADGLNGRVRRSVEPEQERLQQGAVIR